MTVQVKASGPEHLDWSCDRNSGRHSVESCGCLADRWSLCRDRSRSVHWWQTMSGLRSV